MITVLFSICLIMFMGKFLIYGFKVSWGIFKIVCYVMFFPLILIGMVASGLIYLAFPILIILGLMTLLTGSY